MSTGNKSALKNDILWSQIFAAQVWQQLFMLTWIGFYLTHKHVAKKKFTIKPTTMRKYSLQLFFLCFLKTVDPRFAFNSNEMNIYSYYLNSPLWQQKYCKGWSSTIAGDIISRDHSASHLFYHHFCKSFFSPNWASVEIMHSGKDFLTWCYCSPSRVKDS